jgi:hypothetical protein
MTSKGGKAKAKKMATRTLAATSEALVPASIAILKDDARRRVRSFYTDPSASEQFQRYVVPILPRESTTCSAASADPARPALCSVTDDDKSTNDEALLEEKANSMRAIDAYMKNKLEDENLRLIIQCKDGTWNPVDAHEVYTQRRDRYHVPNFNPFRRKDPEHLMLSNSTIIRSALCQLNYFMCFIEFQLMERLFQRLRTFDQSKELPKINRAPLVVNGKRKRRKKHKKRADPNGRDIVAYHMPFTVGFDLDMDDPATYVIVRTARRSPLTSILHHHRSDLGLTTRDCTGIAFVYGVTKPPANAKSLTNPKATADTNASLTSVTAMT